MYRSKMHRSMRTLHRSMRARFIRSIFARDSQARGPTYLRLGSFHASRRTALLAGSGGIAPSRRRFGRARIRGLNMMLALVLATAGGCTGAAPTDVSQEVPYFSQSMVHIEAESFTPAEGSAWSPRRWGEDGGFFASTVANTFHSRRGYLHAPANSSSETVASAAITVPATDTYTVLARYEQGYRCGSR